MRNDVFFDEDEGFNPIDECTAKKLGAFDMFNNVIAEIGDIRRSSSQIGCPRCHDGYIGYGEKLGQVNGHVEQQIELFHKCKGLRENIKKVIMELDYYCRDIEDLSLGIVNSFQTEYDCKMFSRGWAYQCKFVNGGNHWSYSGATKDMKEDYDKCLELFKRITYGFDTHNFKIGIMNDESVGYFYFTISGVPGDFEIFFPLNSDKVFNNKHFLDTNKSPMQMGLAWRRLWCIPVYDYFFDGFGTYHIDDLNKKLHEFVSSEKWKEFYNTKFYMKKVTEPGTFRTYDEEVEYDESTQKYLAKILAEEIEANSKEGKDEKNKNKNKYN